MPETWSFVTAGQIVFGPRAIERLGELARRMGLKRVLLVTDRALQKAGVVDIVQEPLRAAGIAVTLFDEGEPEPSFEVLDRLCECIKGTRLDGVIGLGGGSNMDLAKAAATVLTHGGSPVDYVGEDKVPGPTLPVICVPTTAGTGSEVSAASVLTDRKNQIKVGMLSDYLRPRLAIIDPRLTLSCPRKPTADSGMDALTHAIEAYMAIDCDQIPAPSGHQLIHQGRQPLTDCLAEKAILLISASLRQAVHEPNNLHARREMALAATLAGMAFSNAGVALVHALEYPVGGATHCSHGEGNGLLLPFVMRYNLPARRSQLARIAALMGVNIEGKSESDAAESAISAVEQLKRDVGIPERLRDLGVQPEDLRSFAEKAMAIERIVRVNPRRPTVDDMERILQAAY